MSRIVRAIHCGKQHLLAHEHLRPEAPVHMLLHRHAELLLLDYPSMQFKMHPAAFLDQVCMCMLKQIKLSMNSRLDIIPPHVTHITHSCLRGSHQCRWPHFGASLRGPKFMYSLGWYDTDHTFVLGLNYICMSCVTSHSGGTVTIHPPSLSEHAEDLCNHEFMCNPRWRESFGCMQQSSQHQHQQP
jgi:hypothetical protein